MTCLPFVVGVVADPLLLRPAARQELADALRGAVAELRRRVGDLKLVVVSDLPDDVDVGAQHIAAPANLLTVSDVLVIVSEGAPSEAQRAVAELRRGGGGGPGADRAHLLTPRDTGVLGWLVLGENAEPLRLEYPDRYAGDTTHERDFWEGLERRRRFAEALCARGTAPGNCEQLRVTSDELANGLQRKAGVGRLFLYVVTFAALTVHALGSGSRAALVQYGLLATAVAAFLALRAGAFQSRHQDYRTISEALRVRAVWASIGLDTRLDASYLPMQQTELAWIRDVLRIATAFSVDGPPRAAAAARSIVDAWISDQRSYFRRQSERDARRRDAFALATRMLGAIGIACSAAALLLGITGMGWPVIDTWLGKLAIWGTGVAILLREFVRSQALVENANRYQRMYFVFDRALQVVRGSQDDATLHEVAHQLGAVALSEHADWLFVQRERPISLPTPTAG